MAPKKKGKSNKLAKMSDEERARYLQHRADIEEEARRRKQELIARYMRNKLQKEEIFTKINLAKINSQWRFLLRKLKVKEMDQELRMMIFSFKKMIDSKNAVIARLMTSLEHAEDQYSRRLQSHMEIINQFLEISDNRLKYFHDNFEEQKYIMIEQWDDELQRMEMSQREAENHLQLIIFQQKENMEKYTKDVSGAKANEANFTIVTLEQELADMKKPKEQKLESLWSELRQVFTDYVNYHSPKIQQYQNHRQKDAIYRKEIDQHTDQLVQASEVISNYQDEWENLSEELELKSKNAQEKRDSLNKMFLRDKLRIVEYNKKDKEQLTTLSVESYNAIKKLEEILLKGKKIFQMESACRKYEMEGEKVLPWSNESLYHRDNTHMTPGMLDDIEVLEKMDNFWFKYNRVSVHAVTLKAERDNLKHENKYLKTCLKNLLMEAALGGNKADGAEISGRPASMRMYRIAPAGSGIPYAERKRPVTCIEASTCNAVQHERRVSQWKVKNKEQPPIIHKHCW